MRICDKDGGALCFPSIFVYVEYVRSCLSPKKTKNPRTPQHKAPRQKKPEFRLFLTGLLSNLKSLH